MSAQIVPCGRGCGPLSRRRLPRPGPWVCVALAIALFAQSDPVTPAAQAGVASTVCKVAGKIPGPSIAPCAIAQGPGRIVGVGKKIVGAGGKILSVGGKLLRGNLGGAAQRVIGGALSTVGTAAGKAVFTVGFAAIGAWVAAGAQVALRLTASVIDRSTRPQLQSTWFSGTYWRIAGIAAVLTMPFLFAAAIQALLRSDLTLLLRSALGYLPLSLLAVSIAAPITMLVLAACDGMSATVAAASGGAATRFLTQLGVVSGGLSLLSQSPFVSFLVGLLLVGAAIVLWVEMLMREAAIYVVVLMLPLVFAGFVWPARRVWATRTIELLAALILSKFAVVCVLALGGAALGHSGGGVGGMLVGLVLVTLAACAPWALMRLLPMAELAGAAAGHLRAEMPGTRMAYAAADIGAAMAGDWASTLPARMNRQAHDVAGPPGAPADPTDAPGRAELPAPAAGPGSRGQNGRRPGGADAVQADLRPEPVATLVEDEPIPEGGERPADEAPVELVEPEVSGEGDTLPPARAGGTGSDRVATRSSPTDPPHEPEAGPFTTGEPVVVGYEVLSGRPAPGKREESDRNAGPGDDGPEQAS